MKKKSKLIIALLGLLIMSCNSVKNAAERTIYIGAETKPCQMGAMEADCMQVKWTKDQSSWENFGLITEIQGFEYEKGFEYELIITEIKNENPPADGSSITYTLVKEVKKTKK